MTKELLRQAQAEAAAILQQIDDSQRKAGLALLKAKAELPPGDYESVLAAVRRRRSEEWIQEAMRMARHAS